MCEARKIQGLLLITDLLIGKLAEHEDINEGDAEDALLLRLTGDSSDAWASLLVNTLDENRDKIYEQCQAVIMAWHKHQEAKVDAREHCNKLSFAREEARMRFEQKKKNADKS